MPSQILSDATIKTVLSLRGTAAAISEATGVSESMVYKVKRLGTAAAKRCAEEMTAAGEAPAIWEAPQASGRLTPEQVQAIRSGDEPSPVVARRYGCSSAMVRMIRTGRAYRG